MVCSRLDSCETGCGWLQGGLNGVSQLSDVLPAGSAGSAGQGPAGQGQAGRREVGVVKRGDAKADPGSPKKTRVGFS